MNNANLLAISAYISIMAALACRNSSINANKKIRTNFRFYPKHYMIPPRWIRKLFSLPKKEVAKFLVWHLFFSLAHIALGIINATLLLIDFPASVFIAKCLIMFQTCWVLIDAIAFCVLLRRFAQQSQQGH